MPLMSNTYNDDDVRVASSNPIVQKYHQLATRRLIIKSPKLIFVKQIPDKKFDRKDGRRRGCEV